MFDLFSELNTFAARFRICVANKKKKNRYPDSNFSMSGDWAEIEW